jgi:hypothetical protein
LFRQGGLRLSEGSLRLLGLGPGFLRLAKGVLGGPALLLDLPGAPEHRHQQGDADQGPEDPAA